MTQPEFDAAPAHTADHPVKFKSVPTWQFNFLLFSIVVLALTVAVGGVFIVDLVTRIDNTQTQNHDNRLADQRRTDQEISGILNCVITQKSPGADKQCLLDFLHKHPVSAKRHRVPSHAPSSPQAVPPVVPTAAKRTQAQTAPTVKAPSPTPVSVSTSTRRSGVSPSSSVSPPRSATPTAPPTSHAVQLCVPLTTPGCVTVG